jgi:phospholipid/cholesterol/gamma-HCH transport system permease protein
MQLAQNVFGQIGRFVVFTAATLWLLPVTLRRYRRQTLHAMNDLAWGRGSIIVDGGVISVLVILGVAIGGTVAVEAYSTLNLIGFGALSGIVGGLANVREMAPLVAGIAFASQAGCRMTERSVKCGSPKRSMPWKPWVYGPSPSWSVPG